MYFRKKFTYNFYFGALLWNHGGLLRKEPYLTLNF